MRDIKVYGTLAIEPINFPDEVRILIYPQHPDTGIWSGNPIALTPNRSWEWIKMHYPVTKQTFIECERYLRDGEIGSLIRDIHPITVPDDFEVQPIT